MALCLANSLVARRDFIPYDQFVRYKWWNEFGYMSATGYCFDIGTATRARRVLPETGPGPARVLAGSGSENFKFSGSGSGLGLEKILKIGSIVGKHRVFMIKFSEFFLVRNNNQISVKENKSYNSFKFISLFFNQNISSTFVKERTKN
jgi:hypothetical protein